MLWAMPKEYAAAKLIALSLIGTGPMRSRRLYRGTLALYRFSLVFIFIVVSSHRAASARAGAADKRM